MGEETRGQEWTAERAFADIIGAIENPEDFSEQITAVQSAFTSGNSEEEATYKKRYEKLREDYRRRFLGEMQEDPEPDEEMEEDTNKEITINDLDFDGMTE